MNLPISRLPGWVVFRYFWQRRFKNEEIFAALTSVQDALSRSVLEARRYACLTLPRARECSESIVPARQVGKTYEPIAKVEIFGSSPLQSTLHVLRTSRDPVSFGHPSPGGGRNRLWSNDFPFPLQRVNGFIVPAKRQGIEG